MEAEAAVAMVVLADELVDDAVEEASSCPEVVPMVEGGHHQALQPDRSEAGEEVGQPPCDESRSRTERALTENEPKGATPVNHSWKRN